MLHTELASPSRGVGREYWQRFLILGLLAVTTAPAWAADKAKDEETLRNASTVLSAMLESNNVPADLLARAYCVVVLPGVKKFGFGVGGSGGRGPMSCRKGKYFKGKWSAPAMYTVSGASVGLQVGGSSSDYVLLVMTQKGVDAILQAKTKLGSNASAAAGPTGATAQSVGSDILTYGRTEGLFAGASLGGATLEADKDANQRLYGKAISADEILMQNAVQATPGGESLVALLDTKIAKHGG
jgi:SH3 domain-containing YSC84-like protein 1